MMYWGNGMSGWGMAFMTVGTILFWGLVVAGIVFLLRQNSGRVQTTATTQTDPQRILAGRYARGEIDDEEYSRRSAVLRGSGPSTESQPGESPEQPAP
jgi:putative membrane protein